MSYVQHVFQNHFEEKRITPERLSVFAKDVVVRLSKANTDNIYTDIINHLSVRQENLHHEVGDIDVSLTEQKRYTMSVDEFVSHFKSTMREQEGHIAQMLGGFKSAGYREFYPDGVTEYSHASKLDMPRLLNRINTMCMKYRNQLGEALFSTIQSLEPMWNSVRTEQEMAKGTVKASRTDRGAARKELENALMYALFSVGQKHSDNMALCSSFFDFSLLYSASRINRDDEKNDTISATGSTEEQVESE